MIRSRAVAVGAAAAASIALLAAAGRGRAADPAPAAAGSARAPAPTAAPGAAAPPRATSGGTAQERFPDLVAAAEKATGARFAAPLPIEVLDPAALRARAEAEVRAVPPERWAEARRVLAALEAVAPDVDLARVAVEVRAAQAVARIDGGRRALLLGAGALGPDGALRPEARTVVLGALVRALDAERGPAPAAAPEGDDAREAALLLREGDAALAMLRAGTSPPGPDDLPGIVERMRASGQAGLEKVPPFVRELLLARFTDGALLAAALERSGGRALVDRALAAPPATTEGALHPEKYLAGERPARLAPAADDVLRARGYARAAERQLGELAIRAWLTPWIGREAAAQAAAGWDGDRAVVHGKAGAPDALLWTAALDVEADAEELEAALAEVASRRSPPRRSGACRVFARGERADALCRKDRVVGFAREVPADVAAFLAGELAGARAEATPPAPPLPGARFAPAPSGTVATSRGVEEGRRYVHRELGYALARPEAPPMRFVPGPTSTGSEATPVVLEPPTGEARLRVSVLPVEGNGVELAARVSRGLAGRLGRGQIAPASQARRADGREAWASRFTGKGGAGRVLVVAGDGRTYVLVATWSERTPQPTVDAIVRAQDGFEVLAPGAPAGR